MSGGRLISDHSSWVGKSTSDSVLPRGTKHKTESSAEGAGKLSNYEDTSDKIRASQVKSKEKINSHASKPMYRN